MLIFAKENLDVFYLVVKNMSYYLFLKIHIGQEFEKSSRILYKLVSRTKERWFCFYLKRTSRGNLKR